VSILIIDLSNVNGHVDWRAVKRAGIQAAYLKATEGVTFNDSLYSHHRETAEANGIPTGAYHFARPDRNQALAEAEHFAAIVGHIAEGELRPALDMEQAVDRLGVGPLFYSYPAFVTANVHPSKPIGYGLWLAAYDRNDGTEHPYTVPAPWKKAVAHQFTSKARVAGVPGFVDLSHAGSIRPLLAHPKPAT
jgi:GH25 family lysozyme M1 (1,4-beta-N-acetylmuramidase)